MPSKTPNRYIVCNKQFIEWDQFVKENEWLSTQTLADDKAPKNITAEYYLVDLNEKTLLDKSYIVTWTPEYKEDFKNLNMAWIKNFFEKLEPMDYHQLDSAEENIVNTGGEVFFAVNKEGQVVGTVGMAIHDGECELVKMSVKEDCQGKGYSHFLMRAAMGWARDNKKDNVEILGNTKLESSISLYKKYGFKTISLGSHPLYNRVNIHMRWSAK